MKILLTLATILLALTLNAQEISGTYFEGPDSISINNNHVKFSMRGNDGLGVVFTGEGTFEVLDDFIIINTRINTAIILIIIPPTGSLYRITFFP